MKKPLTVALVTLILATMTSCALAQQLAMPAHPITVEAHVRGPDGNPIEGATIHLALPRYQLGDSGQRIDAQTDHDGVATLSGIAQQDYAISAEKSGYYRTAGPHRSLTTEIGLQQYAVGVQKVELELRPIRDPIRSITKFVDHMLLPVFDKSVGFDLEVGDWVTPFGKGRVADFIFKLEGRFSAPRDYDQTFIITFSQTQDGIMPVKYPKRTGPAFKFPYEAPLTGYESQYVWHLRWSDPVGSSGTSLDLSGETNYIFRVRTELDDKGNIRRALYGVIDGELIPVSGNNEVGRNVKFTYVLNPDWTRNIEFDEKKMFEAGTGKLLVQPPPEH